MFDHLFIAEKPSLAEEVAKSRAEEIGATARRERDHWKVGPDAVTWLAGHMYELAEPQEYDQRYSRWSVEDLPIVPSRWRLVPSKDKVSRLREVKGLIGQAKTIVNVGDAGREGQLLVDEVLVEAGRDPFKPDVRRLWVKSMARKDMLDALRGMFANADKENLYKAAVCRQRADWLHGMNMTRLYTGLARRSGHQGKPLSVGRVQTPTLRLVVDRDREIENFKPVDHYMPTGVFKHANGEFRATWIIPADHEGLDPEGRLVDKSVAERVAAKVAGKTGAVESFAVAKKTKAPPLPYALSNLQKECSAKFGLTAQQTLDVAQSLYEEHKVTTYPRSDSQYLPLAILKDEAPQVLDNLKGVPELGGHASRANPSLKSPAWNDGKVSDHHAIIPTTEATPAKIAALPPLQRKVFDLIARNFVAQFYPDHRWDSLSAVVAVEGERFKATGRKVTDPGWKVVFEKPKKGEDEDDKPEKDKDEDEDDQELPAMAKGDPVTALKAWSESKRTTPPNRFTEGTLIEAMKAVHRFVQDNEVKKRLKESSGIGTEATRANILETLKRRTFLQTKGKYIVSTTIGRSLIDMLDPNLKDPALTAVWEDQLERINSGELSLERFLEALAGEVQRTVSRLASTTIKIAGAAEPLPGTGDTCPQCGKGHLLTRTVLTGDNKGKRYLSCDAYRKDDPQSCRFAKWPEDARKPVPKLDGDGETCPQCGKGHLVTRMVPTGEHKGKRYLSCDGYRKDDPGSCRYTAWEKVKVDPLPGHGETCPQCGKGHLVTRMVQGGPNKGKRFLSCDGWRKDDPNSCRYSAWEKDKVEPLPGDGQTCPNCGKGRLVTRMVHSGDRKGDRFLSCDAWRKEDPNSCRYSSWPKAKVDPLPGDGQVCPNCRKGHMVTRMVQSGDSKGKRFLSCDAYRKEDPDSCRHSIWPDSDRKPGGGKPGAGRPGSGNGRRLPANRSSR